MNYYKRHLGDYAKDAGHLSLLEHGAFTLLLDRYYSSERPLTADDALRICRARTAEERAAVDYVLATFFTQTADGFRNKRADTEIEAYNDKAERNRQVGKKGGRPKASGLGDGNPEETQTVSKREPKPNPSHKPLAISQEEASKPSAYSSPSDPSAPANDQPKANDPVPPCPHADIVAMYHSMLPAHPRIKVWDSSRAANLRQRWREDSKRQSLDYWQRFFKHVAASPFLAGRASSGDRRPFVASLDWLVMPKNFAKVIEGRYHDGETA